MKLRDYNGWKMLLHFILLCECVAVGGLNYYCTKKICRLPNPSASARIFSSYNERILLNDTRHHWASAYHVKPASSKYMLAIEGVICLSNRSGEEFLSFQMAAPDHGYEKNKIWSI